jgi:hypothetical protein
VIDESPDQPQDAEQEASKTIFGDMRSEDEKYSAALQIAFKEITKGKEGEADEELNQTKEARKKGYLGTHAMIKLPYVIGTPEFNKHPYAGLVFLGLGGLEQDDLHKEEM